MESICRACRKPLNAESFGLANNSDRFGRPVWEMMYDCTQIEVTTEDNFPSSLCLRCLRLLETSYEFLMMCRESMEFFLATMKSDSSNIPVDIQAVASTTADNKDPPSSSESDKPTNTNSQYFTTLKHEIKEEPAEEQSESENYSTDDDSLLTPLKTEREAPAQKKSRIERYQKMKEKRARTSERYQEMKEKNRARTSAWRASRTPEQIMAEREKNRLRTAQRREAKRNSAQGLERERLENRLRTAMWRAKRTPEELQADREKDRERRAMSRKIWKEESSS
ncbi:cyclin-dependent kinase 11B-like [Armigeres subalbatus]|uniref:cyclin-dependent kinase 11B-like n=1 Tax=Armigeres subalbatus TaxID=124917 RepID=UPI002ED09898